MSTAPSTSAAPRCPTCERQAAATLSTSHLGEPIGPGPGPYTKVAPGGAAYGATKIALERFTQGLAAEVFEDRISVNALSPHLPIWSEGGAYFRQRSGSENYSGWRMSGDIIGDAAVVVCNQPAGQFTGNILYDEFVMREQGGLGDAVMEHYPVEP